MSVRTHEIETPAGMARATVHRPVSARGSLILGHGAGGLGWSKDIEAVRDAAVSAAWAVALVDQPWRVAGKKVSAPPPTLDTAWVPIVETLRTGRSRMPGPLVVGGRSAGARVACRTAAAVGAGGVACLSFPLHPPGRPDRTRIAELLEPLTVGLPTLVVQGARDPFGGPDEVRGALVGESCGDRVELVAVPGTHTLGTVAPVAEAVIHFLERLT